MKVTVEGYNAEKDEEFSVTFDSVDLIKVAHESDDGIYIPVEGGEMRILQKEFQVENVP